MKIIALVISLVISSTVNCQNLSRYNEATKYLMNHSYSETEQLVYGNIVDRAFSLNLEIDDFYDHVNNQSDYALTTIKLFLIDEHSISGEDSGLFMLIFIAALNEGTIEDFSNKGNFNRHIDWSIVLRSYTLSASIAKLKLQNEYIFDR